MVGEGVAFVLAETAAQARDAAELVMVDFNPLPASAVTATALDDDAFVLWEDIGNNEALVHEIGDKDGADAAFNKAEHIVEHKVQYFACPRQRHGDARLPGNPRCTF